MSVIALDLGGTKLASAVFSRDGQIRARQVDRLGGMQGPEVGALLARRVQEILSGPDGSDVEAVGVSVPGIYYARTGTVWAPNVPGWTEYPLRDELRALLPGKHVGVDSDRACSILGEVWRGSAQGCRNVIFVAVGTGIGAGILIDGSVLRGHSDVAGATGWMALDRPYRSEYAACGCFEHYASGPGIAKTARRLLAEDPAYTGPLRGKPEDALRAEDVFAAEASGDPLARRVIDEAVACWGMATANYVSLFNPELIVFGGGIFGLAARFLDRIYEEALLWAQPVSIRQVRLACSSLGPDAALYGAGRLALSTATA
ncbi:MAG TPA: ROK family protein [Rhodothermales bacterium]|nr:ROK family protein [Rhodothermales bacterium]